MKFFRYSSRRDFGPRAKIPSGAVFCNSKLLRLLVESVIDKNIQIPDKGTITMEFDNLDIKGKRKQIEECLQTIDENIIELRTYAS